MRKRECELTRVVTREGFSIDQCAGCGVFHLHMGPVSLRIDAPSLDALAEGLRMAGDQAAGAEPLLGAYAPLAQA